MPLETCQNLWVISIYESCNSWHSCAPLVTQPTCQQRFLAQNISSSAPPWNIEEHRCSASRYNKSATSSAWPSRRHRSASWLSQLPPFVCRPHVWVCNAVSLLAGSKQEQHKEQLILLQWSNILLVLLTTHGANVLLTWLFKCTHAISFPVWVLKPWRIYSFTCFAWKILRKIVWF